jgi:hypothetical protein
VKPRSFGTRTAAILKANGVQHAAALAGG